MCEEIWFFAHLIVTLNKLLSFENKNKIYFYFVFCSLNRNFVLILS